MTKYQSITGSVTNSKVNEKKKVITLWTMIQNANTAKEFEAIRRKCKAYKVKYDLLALMDKDTFRRAMSEEFNQVDNFLIK